MNAIGEEREALTRLMRQNLGKMMHEPHYATAQAVDLGFMQGLIGNHKRGVDNSRWQPLQNALGIPYFMVGYDAVGDPCHPIRDSSSGGTAGGGTTGGGGTVGAP